MLETREQIRSAAQIFFSEDGTTGRDAGEGRELLAALKHTTRATVERSRCTEPVKTRAWSQMSTCEKF